MLGAGRQMRRLALPAVAFASIIAAGLFASGYGSRLRVFVVHGTATPTSVSGREVILGVEEGRGVAWLQTLGPTPPGSLKQRLVVAWTGWHAGWDARPSGHVSFKRATWEFDAHPLTPGPPVSVYILAAPIWFIELPCLVAPLLWLRDRRRRQQAGSPEGFSVAATAAHGQADPLNK